MSHEISPGPHPNVICVRFFGVITGEDMELSTRIVLASGRDVYMLCDVNDTIPGLPENFLERARNSYLFHPSFRHGAVISTSRILTGLAKMLGKLTGDKNKLSFHTSYDAALSHLQTVMEQAEAW
jgi:hypothetical protein